MFLLANFIQIKKIWIKGKVLREVFTDSPNCARYTMNCFHPLLQLTKMLIQSFNNSKAAFDYVFSEISNYQRGSSNESRENLEIIKQSLLYSIICNTAFTSLTQNQIFHNSNFKLEMPYITHMYKCREYLQEVFYFHHGLRFSHKNILDYVKSKDIIDIGAYIGDSLLVLHQYTNRRIFSYELSEKNRDIIRETMHLNHISPDKVVVIGKGISNFEGFSKISNEGGPGVSLNSDYNGSFVPISTIDAESQSFNMKIGFIKADVEGHALKVLHGATNVIKNHRPVMDIAIYHSIQELFGVRFFMESFENYCFEYHSSNINPFSIGEISLFAFPCELIHPNNHNF